MAASGRLYTFGFQNVNLAAVQDVLALFASSTRPCAVHAMNLDQITGTAVTNLRLRIRFLPATVTPGTGGTTSGVVNKTNSNDAAASATCGYNNTGQATSGGTIVDWIPTGWNTVNGFVWNTAIAGRPFWLPISTGLVLSLDTAPSSLVSNGSMTFEEF